MSFETIREAIIRDPDNAEPGTKGYLPLYTASRGAKIAVIGQAPGRKAQESGTTWNDASGATLFEWLGESEARFRDPEQFAVLPMDFYFPGKGTSGDLPPRNGFAARWHPPLLELMPHVQLTILVGRYAQDHYLAGGGRRNLTETVRAFRHYLPTQIPVVHPSPLNFRWHAKNPWFETELLPVLRARVAQALGSTATP